MVKRCSCTNDKFLLQVLATDDKGHWRTLGRATTKNNDSAFYSKNTALTLN